MFSARSGYGQSTQQRKSTGDAGAAHSLGGHPQQSAVGSMQKRIPSIGAGGSPGGNTVRDTIPRAPPSGDATAVTTAAIACTPPLAVLL